MTNSEAMRQLQAKTKEHAQSANKVFVYDKGTRRLVVVDANEAGEKDLLNVGPEDMKVSAAVKGREAV